MRRGWICIDVPIDPVNYFAIIDNPGIVSIDKTYHNMIQWCKNMFKEHDWHSKISGENLSKFIFKNPSDATLFVLKWVDE